MRIEKHLVITSTNSILHSMRDPTRLWRSWTVQIQTVDGDPMHPFVDHVEYRLHSSFQPSTLITRQEPYMIKQTGWGEFDLCICFHFVDRTFQAIWFDLHFRKNHYSINETLAFVNPSSMLFNRLQQSCSQSSPCKRRRSQSSSSSNSAPSEASAPGLQTRQRRQYRCNYGRLANGSKVDFAEIDACIQSLDDENLRKVYAIFSQHDVSGVYIVETQDEVHFDLYTLDQDLLASLWEFVQKVKKQKFPNQVS